jgi:hypothetical protein
LQQLLVSRKEDDRRELPFQLISLNRRNALEAEQKELEVVTSLQQRLPEAERKIKAADGKVDGRNIYKADLQAVLIIKYHKNVRQVSKSTIKKPELVTMYENCVNASVILPPPGAVGETDINFGGGMLEEEDGEPSLP